MTSATPPSWDGIPDRVLLVEPMGIGTIVVGVFLSIATLGIFGLMLGWDWWTRAHAVGREGIVTHRGVLPWSELEDAAVETQHSGGVGRLSSVSFLRLRFASRSVLVGPWGAPDPELALRALSAGVGRPLEVQRPTGRNARR